jgi:hypothetical protein
VYFALKNSILALNACGNRLNELELGGSAEYRGGELVLFDFLPDDMVLSAVFSNGTIMTIDPQGGNVSVFVRATLHHLTHTHR